MKKYYKILEEHKKDNFQKFYEIGFLSEKEYSGCGQATIAPFVELLEINEIMYKAASGLLAGIGYRGDACGAYVAGVMVISYIFGREYIDLKDDVESAKEKYRRTAKIVNKFREKFIDKYNGINCKEVQVAIFGRFYNLLNPTEKIASLKAGSHIDKCTSVVGNAARIVAELIYSELKEDFKE